VRSLSQYICFQADRISTATTKQLDLWARAIFSVALISLLIVGSITWYSSDSGYSHINAVTKSFSLITTDKLTWYFDEVTLKNINDSDISLAEVYIDFAPSQTLIVTRNYENEIFISVKNLNDNLCNATDTSGCAWLQYTNKTNDDVDKRLPAEFDLSFKDPKASAPYYFRGQATFGTSHRDRSTSEYFPLLSGEVILYGKHTFFPNGSHYTTSPLALSIGDLVTIGAKGATTYGVLTFQEQEGNNAMLISATSDSTMAFIKRYRTDELEITNGWSSRFFNDQGLTLVWSGVVLLISVLVWLASEIRR